MTILISVTIKIIANRYGKSLYADMDDKQNDVKLIKEALPALLRMANAIDRLDYLEEISTFEATVGRVYQCCVSDWLWSFHEEPGWKSPLDDPYAITKTDKLWRLSQLLREMYPKGVATVDKS